MCVWFLFFFFFFWPTKAPHTSAKQSQSECYSVARCELWPPYALECGGGLRPAVQAVDIVVSELPTFSLHGVHAQSLVRQQSPPVLAVICVCCHCHRKQYRNFPQITKKIGTRETISLWISTGETVYRFSSSCSLEITLSFSEFSIFFQCCFEAQNLMQYYLKRTRAYSQGLYGGSSHVLFPQWRLQYGFAYSGQFHGLSSFVPKFAGSFISCRVKILHWCSGSL